MARKKVCPVHPGEILLVEFLDPLGVSQYRLAKELSVPARRINEICGLNTVGLRRAGFRPEERLELKRLYRALFRGSNNLKAAVAAAHTKFTGAPSRTLLDFLTASKRGVAADVSRGAGSEQDAEND